MPTSQPLFAKQYGAHYKKEQLFKFLLKLATYSILLFTLFIFWEMFSKGAPVLKQHGVEFLKRKPETLEVIIFDAGDKLEIPKESYDTMITYNPDVMGIEKGQPFKKSFDEVSFKIQPESRISDGYLYNIEKRNNFKGEYLARETSKTIGFSLSQEARLLMPETLYDEVVAAVPAFASLSREQKELKESSYEVIFAKKKCEMQAKTLVKLAKSPLIYKLYGNLKDTADDKPDELLKMFIPRAQIVTLTPVQYNALKSDTGTAEVISEKELVQEYTKSLVIWPAGQHTLPYSLFLKLIKECPSFAPVHLHNLERGVIALKLAEETAPLVLPKAEFDQMKADNPHLILSDIKPQIQEKDFVRFNLPMASEVKLPTTDMSALRQANKGAVNENDQKRLKVLSEHVYPYSGGGVSGPIVGTILLVATCMTIALLIGISAAIYLGEYSKKGPLIKVIRLSMMNLAGVPSIVFGIFGLGLFVSIAPKVTNTPSIDDKLKLPVMPSLSEPALRTQERNRICLLDGSKDKVHALRAAQQQGYEKYYNGWYYLSFQGWGNSIIAGAFTLALMVLPIIITSSEESLRAVPMGFREASLALGATKWQAIKTAVLPYATPGMLTASVLGVTRVAGETAPIMFTAAVAAKSDLPFIGLHGEGLGKFLDFIAQSVQAMPYHIYTISGKLPPSPHIKPMQYGSVLVFMIIVMTFAALSVWLRIRMRKKYKW